MTCENWKETADFYTPGDKRWRIDNREAKSPKRSTDETPRKIKTFESSQVYWKIGGKAHTQDHRNTYTEKAWEDLKLFHWTY